MKKLILVFTLFYFSLLSFSQKPYELYEKYKDNKDVTVVVLNEELFKMVDGMEVSQQKEINNILDDMDKMLIISSEKLNFLDELDLSKYDELINVKNKNERVKICGKIKNGKIKKLIILSQEETESNLIYIEGDLDLEKLGELSSNFSK